MRKFDGLCQEPLVVVHRPWAKAASGASRFRGDANARSECARTSHLLKEQHVPLQCPLGGSRIALRTAARRVSGAEDPGRVRKLGRCELHLCLL
jgi:hypothetical protein